IGWKAQAVKGDRALAVAYIDARDVMDRLDAVLGAGGWQDNYTGLADGNGLCRLTLLLDGIWIPKEEGGGEGGQQGAGGEGKGGCWDALRGGAVKGGIGRYLYRLEAVWCDYDAPKKQIKAPPRLPAWALPAGAAPVPANGPKKPMPPPPPADGAELEARLLK